MKIENVAFQTTDWSKVPKAEHRGESGIAHWCTLELGNVRVRMVDYKGARLFIVD